ncbi:MAG TPA: T9SS type A sorting domain-containing protein, partial [Bacteroidia bacterium]|nr:T9SS type A sorting domain-containing protein [Bacteroidia bacterium]
TDSVLVDCTLGVNAASAENSVNVYPNPNDGVFGLNIQMNTGEKVIVEIYNETGQIVKGMEVTDNTSNYKTTINLSEFGRGIYLVRVTSGKEQLVKRVIVD